MEGGVYWRAAFIRGGVLEGGGGRRLLGVYWRAAFIGGRRLMEGGVYWRAAFIRGGV